MDGVFLPSFLFSFRLMVGRSVKQEEGKKEILRPRRASCAPSMVRTYLTPGTAQSLFLSHKNNI